MAVRRRRPLVPPPYPRRNRYTPLSSGQTVLCSLRPAAKANTAPLSLLFPSQTLRWFVMGVLWGKNKLRSTRSRLRRELATLRCPFSSHRKRFAGLRREPCGETQSPLVLFCGNMPAAKRSPGWDFPGYFGRLPMEIVTHPAVGMCYNSMTFQVLVNFTISFTGVTLASSR